MNTPTQTKKTKKKSAPSESITRARVTARGPYNAVPVYKKFLFAANWDKQSRTEVFKQLNKYISKNNLGTEGNAFALHKAVMHGIAFLVAETLKDELNINDDEMAEVLGTSESTLLRWRKFHKDLDNNASDRLVRFARILEMATDVFDDKQKALSWLKRPQFGLGGKVPIELMKSEAGAHEVENLLMRIEHGVLA